jgi:hypothetical protein
MHFRTVPDWADVKYTSQEYLSITEEIKQSENAPVAEIPTGEPWDVHLPTSLIRLRRSDTLPTWTKDPNTGKWVPDADST